jgi:hypothetical protein
MKTRYIIPQEHYKLASSGDSQIEKAKNEMHSRFQIYRLQKKSHKNASTINCKPNFAHKKCSLFHLIPRRNKQKQCYLWQMLGREAVTRMK